MPRHILTLCAVAALVAADTADAFAQAVYPAKGQSAQTQARDEANCSGWATQKTGYDPAHPPAYVAATPAPVTGSGARVKGAAAGAVIGGVSGGDAGDAALAGAAAGGVVRRSRNRRAARAQNEAASAQMASADAAYREARAACLTGKGYSVR